MLITSTLLGAAAFVAADTGEAVNGIERCSRSTLAGRVSARSERRRRRASASSSSRSSSSSSSSVSVSSSSSSSAGGGRSRARATSSTIDEHGRRVTIVHDERGCRVFVDDAGDSGER